MARSSSPAAASPRAVFQSQPTDLDLVNTYLRPWVEDGSKVGPVIHDANGRKVGPFIHEADVYADDPAVLTRKFAPAVAQDGERAWYFFTPLRRKSEHGTRKTRTVATGVGCWHNEAKSKPVFSMIDERQHQVGHRQSFSFVKKEEGGARVRTGWLMMELRLLKDADADAGAVRKPRGKGCLVAHRVLCKVYRSPRNPEPIDGEPAADDEYSTATPDDGSEGETTDSYESSDAAAFGRHKKPDEDEPSAGAVAAPGRDGKEHGKISGAATAPGRKNKAEADDEGSVESTASPLARKRKAEEDGGSLGAEARARKRTAGGSPSAPSVDLLCPNCGIHIAASVSIVAPANKSKPEAKSEAAEIAKGESPRGAPAPQQEGQGSGAARAASEKKVRFHQFL